MGGLKSLRRRGVVAPRKGPGENDHKGARSSFQITKRRSPKMVRTWKPCTNEKIINVPVFIIFKGLSLFLFGVYPLFSSHSLFKQKQRHEIEPVGGGGC